MKTTTNTGAADMFQAVAAPFGWAVLLLVAALAFAWPVLCWLGLPS